MSLLSRLFDFAGRKFAEEFGGGDATGPIAVRLPCSGYDETAQAERAGGKPLDDPFSSGPHGDWPFLPADLKISRFHGERK